jgi:FHS family L-fucose permease-like MFS transporter
MPDSSRQRAAFFFITALFFSWGFATSLIDPLVAAVKQIFALNYTEAFLTSSAWFIAYGVMSLPAAALLRRTGYSRAIVIALGVMVLGCLIVPVATAMDRYAGVLLALFVIASGVTLLQVAANPLAALIGDPARSHLRLTFSQAFNSAGTTLGPWFGSHFLLTGGLFAAGVTVTAATRAESLRAIDISFLIMGGFLALLAAFILKERHTIDAAVADDGEEQSSVLEALRSPWALAGAAAIFLYVGAEVSIGAMLTSFLHGADVFNIPLASAGKMVAWYWGGAMVGRFIGSALMTRITQTHRQ